MLASCDRQQQKNNPAYISIKPRTHKANVLDLKSEKKHELGSCFVMQMQADHGQGETPSGYELNLNLTLRNYLTIHLNRKERD
jgi:hypothetical protein